MFLQRFSYLTLIVVFQTALSFPVRWSENVVHFTLPPYMQQLKNELDVQIDKNGNLALAIPNKSPDYWLQLAKNASDKDVAQLLRSNHKQGKTLINAIKETYPHLKALYESPASITENHTLEQHTLNVLHQFHQQKKYYDLKRTAYKAVSSDIEKLMTTVILLHDIGKPLGARKKQHEYTKPIAKYALYCWGFSKAEINCALALIDNDILGELVQAKKYNLRINTAYQQILTLAQKVGLHPADYFDLQMLFFVSDASSYFPIRKASFITPKKSKILLPKHKRFWIIRHKVRMADAFACIK